MRKLGLISAVFLMTALYNVTVILAQTGNGAPSGPHYNLNIIGVTNGKKALLIGSDRYNQLSAITIPVFLAGHDIELLNCMQQSRAAAYKISECPQRGGYELCLIDSARVEQVG